METSLVKKFEFRVKGSTEEALKGSRKLNDIDKNSKRRSRYPANLCKRRIDQVFSLYLSKRRIDQIKEEESSTKQGISPDHWNLNCQLSSSGEEIIEGQLDGFDDKKASVEHKPSGEFRVAALVSKAVAWIIQVTGVTLSSILRKAFLKWVSIVLNVGVEAYQAAFSQEVAVGQMSRHNYLTRSIITSSACLIMSLIEACQEACSNGAQWPKSVCCFRSSYPGSQDLLLERFLLYFGMICAMVQLLVNLLAKLGKNIIKFEYTPLFLAIGHLLATIVISHREKTVADILRCKIHGEIEVKPIIVDGKRVFQCSRCQTSSARSNHSDGPLSSPESANDDVQVRVPGGAAPWEVVDDIAPLLRHDSI